jgi:hypothetical protein
VSTPQDPDTDAHKERRRWLVPDDDTADGEPHFEEHAEATIRFLEVVSAVEFLRRGDRRGLTLWAAIEEALRWWTAERVALIDGFCEPSLGAPALGGSETLPATLLRFVAVAGQDQPIHLHLAFQQALRRWAATMAERHNDGHPWPPPAPRSPPTVQLSFGIGDDDGPPDLVA